MSECNWLKVYFNGEEYLNNSCYGGVKYEFQYPQTCSQTSCFPFQVKLKKGNYLVEAYGAEGGGPGDNGGKGGFSAGFLNLKKDSELFAFIGAKGVTDVNTYTPHIFGGGGSGYGYIQEHTISSGGGGSDLRFNLTNFDTRIIVAGGGGGGGYQGQHNYTQYGGDGGGLTAADPDNYGATQERSGKRGDPGSFGFGGDSRSNDGGGGGGGYWGGSGGTGECRGGGGGSGYVDPQYFTRSWYDIGVRHGNGSIIISLYKPDTITCPITKYFEIHIFHLFNLFFIHS